MTTRLDAIALADTPESWADAGFALTDASCTVGELRFDLGVGDAGVAHFVLDGVAIDDLDGIPVARGEGPGPHIDHPNGVVSLDHLVLATPDQDRTQRAFETIGLDCRRVRDIGTDDRPMQQRFYRLGSTIAEVIGSPVARGDGPATVWGLAYVVADIDATAAFYGPDAISQPKDAVQPGRRIATLRHKTFGLSLPVAFMTPHR